MATTAITARTATATATATATEAHTATATEAHAKSGAPAERSRGRIARLVERAARGDVEAWNEIVQQYDGLLWAVARGYRLSEADRADVAQTAWLRLIQYLDALKDPAQVGAWLATTARRECQRKLRASARDVPDEDPPELSNSETPALESGLYEAERDAALWSAFGRLPARDRALLRVLGANPQPSNEELGAELELPVGSIGPTRGRALERLRRELARSEALIELVVR